MRRFDKIKNIQRVNSLIEENYLNNKEGLDEAMLGFKKAFNLDKTYHSVQEMWNTVGNSIIKKFPNLKFTENGAGFTNGVSSINFNFSDFNVQNKTVSINGTPIDFDNVINFITKSLKLKKLI